MKENYLYYFYRLGLTLMNQYLSIKFGKIQNFIGASSKIANYIKLLDPKFRKKFIVEEDYNDYMKQSTHTKKERDNIKALINQHNSNQTFNLKGLARMQYPNKANKKIPCKEKSIFTRVHQESQVFEEIKDRDLTRVHATQRGRKVKVSIQNRNNTHNCILTIPLQPIIRSQVYEQNVN